MPRWLRQFTFNKINDFYKKEVEEYEKSSNSNPNSSTLIDSSGNVNRDAWKSVTPGPKINPGSKVKYK